MMNLSISLVCWICVKGIKTVSEMMMVVHLEEHSMDQLLFAVPVICWRFEVESGHLKK